MSSASKNKANRGCWTCKDRKVRCDRSLPSCANCARVHQTCQGYGVRLSWPREGDTKRSMTSGAPVALVDKPKCGGDIELVHTSYFDLEMYYYLVELRTNRVDERAMVQPPNLILPIPVQLKPINLNAEELELLQYFRTVAYSTLATFSVDPTETRDALVRMAMTDQTIPSRAVLHALLSITSLHRDGMQLQSARHKTAAVGALGASAKNGIQTTTEAAQHVAANMLLCSYEIHVGHDMHSHWPWYLIGARDIIRASNLEAEMGRRDVAELVMWTYYHEALAKFTLLHWHRGSAAQFFANELGAEDGWQRDLCESATRLRLDLGPLPAILRHFGDVIDVLCEPTHHSPASLDATRQEIHTLEEGIKKIVVPPTPSASSSSPSDTEKMASLTELFRTAVLVYIARICGAKLGELRDMKPLLDKAFAQLARTPTCERLFPLFILGCEADSDERRLAVLDILRRTEEGTYVRSLDCLRRGLDSVWIQDDLNADQDVMLNYVSKLNVVISSSPSLPTMV